MMQKPLLCLALFAGTLFSATAQNAGETKTENGFRFVNHTNKPGEKAVPGDLVRVHMSVHLGDTTLMSSWLQGDPPPVPIPPKEAIEQPSPILEALALMTAGDSATVFQKIDSLIRPLLPPSRQNVEEIRFELKLVEVVTAAQQAEQEAKAQAAVAEIAARTKAVTDDFNAGKIGPKLITTASGLQLVIHEEGAGAEVKKGELLSVHYYGALTDGTMFDNSFERGEPIQFEQGVGQMIPGFDEGASLLKHGGKATLFIPAKLGYGEDGTPDGTIPANSTLVFYIEVQ